MKKVLVISSTGIGNFLLSIPLIEFLSKKYRVDILVGDTINLLAKELKGKYINDIINPENSLIKTAYKLFKTRYYCAYYCFPGHLNRILFLIYISCIKYRYGYILPNTKRRLYFSHPHFIQMNSIKNEALMNLQLAFPKATMDYIEKNKHRYLLANNSKKNKKKRICLHVGAGTKGELGKLKRWPIDYWTELIKYLDELEYLEEICILIGPSERGINSYIKGFKKVKFIESTLNELVKILSDSNLFLANDNGISHLAAFCNIPVFTIFGPSNPFKNHPLFNKNNVIFKSLSCSPCQNLIGSTNCTNNEYKKCMNIIYPEEVFEIIKDYIV